MIHFEEIFYIFSIFLFGYLVFKNDIFKRLGKNGMINKDFTNCYILKYPKHAEFHNKNLVYKIDVEEFFKLNPKLKGKVKVIDRPEIDSTKVESIRSEIEERKKIKEKYSSEDLD